MLDALARISQPDLELSWPKEERSQDAASQIDEQPAEMAWMG